MPTILLVDDDLNILSAMAIPLEGAGYRVQRASRLDQAGRIVAADTLDLVLLDVATDHGRGWDLLREIVELRDIPVIVVSGHAIEDDVVAAFEIGAVDFVPKPFRMGELLARVRARLRSQPSSGRATLPGEAVPPAPEVFAAEPEPPALYAMPVRAAPDDTPIFMDAADEQMLLFERTDAAAFEGDIEELPLGERLRMARQRAGMSLVQVELDTRLRIWYIQAMEEARFGLLPRGNAAETMVRNYARYLGVDVEHAARDFRSAYAVQPTQQITNLGAPPQPREIPQPLIIAAAALLALVVGIGGFRLFAPNQAAALSENVNLLINPPTVTPTPTPTVPPTVTPTTVPTATPTPTSTPTATPTETPRPTDTPQPTPDPALTPVASASG